MVGQSIIPRMEGVKMADKEHIVSEVLRNLEWVKEIHEHVLEGVKRGDLVFSLRGGGTYTPADLVSWLVERTLEKLNQVSQLLQRLTGKPTHVEAETELKKEVRRLLWKALLTAKFSPLKKQDETERKEVHILERADETVLSRTIEDLEKIKSRLVRLGMDEKVIRALDDIIQVLRNRL